MRSIILTVTLVALSPTLLLAPARGAVTVGPALACPVRVAADDQDQRPDHARPPNAGEWLWDLLIDRLTVPLGPADQNIWPPGSWRGHWIAATDRGSQPGDASDGRTRPRNGSQLPVASPVASQALATRTSTGAAALETGNGIRSGGHTCDFF